MHPNDEDVDGISHVWGHVHRVLGPSDENPFHVRAYLGHGAVGAVEEVAISKESPRSLVRKKILLPHAGRDQVLKLVQQEVDILKSLTHMHIVKCLGTYEDATQVNRPASYCLLMSPVGNGDLKAFLEEYPSASITERWLRSRRLQQWFVCLSSALQYMHSQGVLHQDIKPSNIVYRGACIYLTDFSSSSHFILGQTTSTESPFRCTAMYAAPEVTARYRDEGILQKHGRGSDIFALGCVFCEMLTVLLGSSVPSLHNYLVGDEARHEEGFRSLLYSWKLTPLDQWFENMKQRYSGYVEVYGHCIKPMIRQSRDSRCTAMTAYRNFEQHADLENRPCPV